MKCASRFWLVVILLLIAVIGILWRMADLMILERGFLLGQGDLRSLRIITIPAYRGIITDRNGSPLAVSVPIDDIWMDPRQFSPVGGQLQQLSRLVKIPISTIQKIYQANIKRKFAYIKRDVTPDLGNQIKALSILGVYVKQEFRRYYPEGEVAAQLLGFTNIDDQGQAGVELEYNEWLQGIPGKKEVLVDRLGNSVANVALIKPAQPGKNLVLSIDHRIQYSAYQALQEALKEHKASTGSVVVLNVKTGEVLAMVNQPSFNPNNRPKIKDGRFRNRAVTDVTEPGSTLKAFSVSNALSSGKFTPSTPINTNPGWMIVDGKTVRDDSNYGLLDVTGVLQKSSNIGVTKMTLTLPPISLFNLLKEVGFGVTTQSGFPGESPGVLDPRALQNQFTLATLSFGYGISVTNLQLAKAYSILANRGVRHPVTLLKSDAKEEGVRVISDKIAREILVMMESVVEEGGTATSAQVPGYLVSGKTGTVRMVGPNGYDPKHHTAIFVGVAPASYPELVVSIVIKNPEKDGYYGGLVAAPVFSKVMGDALRILDVTPDGSNATMKPLRPHIELTKMGNSLQ